MNNKKSWTEPKLTVYGDVEAITQVHGHYRTTSAGPTHAKTFGAGDGFVLINVGPIKDIS